MLLQAYGHADDGELREDEVFRVKMKQEKKKSSPLLSSYTLCPFGLRAPLPPLCFLKSNKIMTVGGKWGEKLPASVTVSLPTRFFQGVATIQALPLRLLALRLTVSPPLLPNVSMEIAA